MTRLPVTIAATSMLVLALGACGSSSSKSTGLNPGANGSPNANSGGGSGGGDLSSLVNKGKTADVKVTYKTGSDGSSVTIIQRGNDNVYTSGDTSVYNVGGKTITCQGTGSSATCTQLPSTGGSSRGLGGSVLTIYNQLIQAAADSPLIKNIKTSSQTIAGRNAKCVTLTGTLAAAAGKSGTVCIDAETGILLKVASNVNNEGDVLVATSVGTPSDSDFTPPAKPQTLTVPSITMPTYTTP